MLNSKNALATIAVKSVKDARRFYGEVLGLTFDGEPEEGVLNFRSGNTTLMVYESEFAGTNKATAATWLVGDELDAIVKTLKERGAAFEHYDFPGMTLNGDIHEGGDVRVAWVKDPDGNILSFANG